MPFHSQPVNAGNHQRLARMDEVEDCLELGPSIQAGPALLLGPDHAAPGRFQGSNLRIEVLFDGRSARIPDFGLISVHFGCAYDMICSLSRNRPKVNRKIGAFTVHVRRHYEYTLSDASSPP